MGADQALSGAGSPWEGSSSLFGVTPSGKGCLHQGALHPAPPEPVSLSWSSLEPATPASGSVPPNPCLKIKAGVSWLTGWDTSLSQTRWVSRRFFWASGGTGLCSLGHSFLLQAWGVARVLRVVFKPRASWQEAERAEPGAQGMSWPWGVPGGWRKGLRGASITVVLLQSHLFMIPVSWCRLIVSDGVLGVGSTGPFREAALLGGSPY